jgi:deoxyadenosine/deoxycytidine kinase
VPARYVVVEGPIGAGKTSLARKLAARLRFEVLLEEPGANPFLPGFYRDPPRYALAAQLAFLVQRARQLEQLGADLAAKQGVVADFLLDKDRLFAALNLDGEEHALYRALYAHVAPRAPTPGLVIYLQASADSLLERARRRGLHYEQGLTRDYVAQVAAAYERFFRDYAAAPLLTVDAERLNFVDRDADFELLLQRMHGLREPRAYFGFG